MLILVLVFLILVGYVLAFTHFRGSGKGPHLPLPPAPRGLPLIGNLHQIDTKKPFLGFLSWATQFGRMYTIRIGSTVLIVLNDAKMIKELFSQDAASGRAVPGDGTAIDLFPNEKTGLTFSSHGVINSEGPHWEELRRFTLRHLRDFGFGRKTMESLIMEELELILSWMKGVEGVEVGGIKDRMSLAIVNSLWRIVSGKRYSQDDPIVKLIKGNTEAFQEISKKGGLAIMFPWVRYVAPRLSGYSELRRVLDEFRDLFTDTVKEHEGSYEEDYQRDFIDVFLKEIKSCETPTSAFYGKEGRLQIIAVIHDLFMAATETTSTTLNWTFLYLSSFLNVQGKMQGEIEKVVGSSRKCELGDRPNLPYVEAVLSEVLRYSAISTVPRKALQDIEYGGYLIPKGSGLLPNFQHIFHSKEVWGDPENFRPERFLNEQGQFKRHEAFIPFSTGRRQCAGETLARDSLFLYIANIFQRFSVRFALNGDPGLEPEAGFVLNPKPYKVVFNERV